MTDAMNETAPRYEHECEGCIYLGQWNKFDLYYCPQGGRLPTVLARYGDRGEEYNSGLALAENMPQLGEARRRAIAAGLLGSDQ
jgi:hypothetical protein